MKISKLKLFVVLLSCISMGVLAKPMESIFNQVKNEQPHFLNTLQSLVSIESGSRDREGLDKISQLVFDRLQNLGAKVEFIEPGAQTYKMHDTPDKPGRMVKAELIGTGSKKILLIAHMDTVYLRGMLAKQPFRVTADRAYGLGIVDDKQGIALILHTLEILQKNNFKDYGKITVFINGDEEISSPASRAYFAKLGAEHDVTFSCESSTLKSDRLALTTAGIGAVILNVTGKASHAGAAPELGRNALTELAYQILQTKDMSDPSTGIKMNWTIASAGTNRNVIPSSAQASADVRVMRKEDFPEIEAKVREKIKNQLIPDTKIEMSFEQRRPPLVTSPQSLAMAKRAQSIYKEELNKDLELGIKAAGGGTDAAFAALDTQNAVIESMGLQGFGSHSNGEEFIVLDSIVPRMYLLTRLIMDVSASK